MAEKQYDADLIKTIPVPSVLTVEQVAFAVQYARAKMLDGHTVGGFCSDNRISTKTWYKFLEVPEFVSYMADIQNLVIPTNEKDAFNAMKKHILKIPFKESPTIKETELFMDVFGYLAEADKREQMEKLGLNNVDSKATKTIEERKASLLTRLKG